MDALSLDDARIVEKQIRRSLRGSNTVAVRCAYGYPQVLTVHPVLDGEPFPTLYWLTCPFLAKAIDRLESQGTIPLLEARMRRQPKLRLSMQQAHRRYRAQRSALLRSDARAQLERSGMLAALESRGIGGIADAAGIKCLHLHVAHALADRNPIGSIVLKMLDACACSPDKVICSTL